MRSERLDANFGQELVQLLPAIRRVRCPFALSQLIDLAAASRQRVPDVLHGQMLKLERPLAPLKLWQLVEPIPLLIKLIGELLLVLARFRANVILEGLD